MGKGSKRRMARKLASKYSRSNPKSGENNQRRKQLKKRF